MAWDLELTISGLCVIVFTADKERPRRPSAVEVLTVDARHCGEHVHVPRLSFWPIEGRWDSDADVPAAVHIDPEGRKHASIDLSDLVVSLECGPGGHEFRVDWADDDSAEPGGELSERLFDWVAPIRSLGVDDIYVPAADRDLPQGSSSRFILPHGELYARDLVCDDEGLPTRWLFEGSKRKTSIRALANEIVFRANGVKRTKIRFYEKSNRQDEGENKPEDKEPKQKGVLTLHPIGRTLKVGLCNDVAGLPKDFNAQQTFLNHLTLLENVSKASVKIKPPEKFLGGDVGAGRTIRVICTQVYYVRPQTDAKREGSSR